jgi:Leucine-rich repeat (LRR) protein
VSLSLERNKLTALPPEIGNLTALQYLDVKKNQLEALPPEVGNLAKLETLNISDNRLRALPPEVSGWVSLQKLYASENQFTRLPPEIGAWTSVESLWLEGNQLSRLPPEIGQCAQLKTLGVWSNHLTALPDEVGDLAHLEDLAVGNNRLQELPATLANLPVLKEISVYSNRLSTFPAVLCDIQTLEGLRAGGNAIGELPAEIGQLHALRALDLYNNNLSRVPPEIGQLRSLKSLNLSHNTELTALPPEIGRLRVLETLKLSYSGLTALPPEILRCRKLKRLSASNCHLAWVPVELSELPHMEELGLDRNPNLTSSRVVPSSVRVDVHASNDHGRMALHAVAPDQAREMVAALLALGADPNAADAWGYTPLHEAALVGHAAAVGLLLEAGANPALRVTKGLRKEATALDLARYESSSWLHEAATYADTIQRLRPVSPDPLTPQGDWYDVTYQRGTYLDRSASKVSHIAVRHYEAGKVHWVCEGSPESGYTCRGEGRPLTEFTHRRAMWDGPAIAEEGCLMCGSTSGRAIYSGGGFNPATGDGWWSCEVYCDECGWYSQWVYDE